MHAYGFGRSGCRFNCFNDHTSSLFLQFEAPRFVSRIRFRYLELIENWGSGGTVYVDGVALPGSFGGEPYNSRVPDSTFTDGVWTVDRPVTTIEIRVADITDLSEIYIDDVIVE